MEHKHPEDFRYEDRHLEVLVSPTYQIDNDIETARRMIDIATSDLETVLRRYTEPMMCAATDSPTLRVRVLVGAAGQEELRRQIHPGQWRELDYTGVLKSLHLSFRWCEAELPFEMIRADGRLLVGIRGVVEPLPQLAPVLRYTDSQQFPALRWVNLFEKVWRNSPEIPDLPVKSTSALG